MTLFDFFTSPVYRGPTLGCIFMCIASSLMGVIIFLKKKSLLSETLSHATYPGACLGVAFFGLFIPHLEEWTFIGVLIGAFISSLLGLKAVDRLQKKEKVYSDAALTFTLAIFFGLGILIASAMQASIPAWHKQTLLLLFGQAATMSDIHIWIYGALCFSVALFLYLTFPILKTSLFDSGFAKTSKLPVKSLERIVFWLLLLSIIVGIRSVGVVLMSGMVIAPAVAARQFAKNLKEMFFLSALTGAFSAGIGNILSVKLDLPTGPSIVLVGSAFAFFSLLFSPKRGLVFRLSRMMKFRLKCIEENLIKASWKNQRHIDAETLLQRIALIKLKKQGWVDSRNRLTNDGKKRGSSIVRLHRLWELYLTEELGIQIDKVHRTAEEMEHILTPEMEEKLTHLLENPTKDPHEQPIPEKSL